jgi:hypothetical protein
VVSSAGDEYETFSDSRSGVPQVMLRSRAFAGPWSAATAVSASPSGAFDPTIALLPGDGLAIAWSDLRDGQSQIYFRARIGGAWGPERRLSEISGGSPAIAADPSGFVHVCWTDPGPPRPRIQYLRFPAGAPGGEPSVVTDSTSRPSAPCITATPSGIAWMAWPDLGTGNYVVQFARSVPDSGLTLPRRLTYPINFAQPSVDVAADTSGSVHFVWQQLATGACELHYERIPRLGFPYPGDTTLVSAPEAVQNPSLFVDRTGAVHVAYERSTSQGQMIRYKRWRPGPGWDYPATDVSNTSDGSAGRVNVLAVTPGDVSVLYSSSKAGSSQVRTRRRRLDPIPTAVEPVAAPSPRIAFRMGPNPLRPGRELRVACAGASEAGIVELFDTAGRRVASARALGGMARFSPAQTRTLMPGLYFAALRGGASGRLAVIR